MVKRQLFLFLALAFNAATIQAQSTSVGFSVGPTMSDLRNSRGNSILGDLWGPKLGFMVEANFTWRFAKNIGIRTGLGFEQKGAKSEVTFTDENGNPTETRNERTNLDYLQIPLMLEIKLGEDINWLFDIGQSYGLLVHNNEDDILGEEFVKTDWSVLAGIGLEFPFKEDLNLQFQTRVSYGLNELAKAGPWETKNFSAGLTAGLQYFLK